MKYNNILVPTDFSANSITAFEFAFQIAKHYFAVLHILHVIEPSLHGESFSYYDDPGRMDHLRILNAEEELRRLLMNYVIPNVKIVESIKSGKASDQIIQYAIEHRIDSIIISSHGKDNFSHMLVGHVTESVMKFADVSVICIKSSASHINKTPYILRNNFAENWFG